MNTVHDGALRTTDMALAALLVVLGHEYTLERLSRTRAQWVFLCDRNQDVLEEVVNRYENFAHRVEPRSFLEELSRLRKEVYELVPPPSRRAGAPSRDGASA